MKTLISSFFVYIFLATLNLGGSSGFYELDSAALASENKVAVSSYEATRQLQFSSREQKKNQKCKPISSPTNKTANQCVGKSRADRLAQYQQYCMCCYWNGCGCQPAGFCFSNGGVCQHAC